MISGVKSCCQSRDCVAVVSENKRNNRKCSMKKSLNDRLQTYARYLQKQTIRKRGNPQWYLTLVESVKPKSCTVCDLSHGLELHHVDGNWKNCSLDNVIWLCTQHHQDADNLISHNKEKYMKNRTIWTPTVINKLNTFCSENNLAGKTLDWCFTNFRSGPADGKYTNRYYANKAAYQKYIKGSTHVRTRAKKQHPQVMKKITPTNPRTITLTQILEYKKIAEQAGYEFILS